MLSWGEDECVCVPTRGGGVVGEGKEKEGGGECSGWTPRTGPP
jgi:hypothetical protein